MKAFEFEKKKSVGPSEQLPPGGYIGEIFDAEIKEYTWGEVLVIYFDISEGQYTDFFDIKYQTSSNEDRKWKGTYRLNIPQEGSEYFESNKKQFGNAIWALEESNPDFHWAWDEKALKGLKVGLIFREREWEMNGRTGVMTECYTFTDVSSIRDGNFKVPKIKTLPKKENSFIGLGEEVVFDEKDLPF